VERLCQAHGIILDKLEPAKVFLQGGMWTVAEYIERHLMQVSLQAGNCPTIVLVEHCDELVLKGCSDESLIYCIHNWLRRKCDNLMILLTTSASLEGLHPVWLNAEIKLQMPADLNLSQRQSLLSLFVDGTGGKLDDDLLKRAAIHSNGFAACDLAELASFLDVDTTSEEISLETSRIRRTNNVASSTFAPVMWNDIYGQEQAKRAIQEAAAFLDSEEVRKRYADRGLIPPKGILLYGPPGTGKTLLARAMATSSKAHFITASLPSLVHAPIGESEMSMRKLFAEAIRLQPSIVFFDEIDALVPTFGESNSVTEKITAQLIEELDSIPPDASILLVAATNLIDNVHVSLRRYGRLSREIFVSPLTVTEQIAMITNELAQIGFKSTPLSSLELRPSLTGAEVGQILARIKYRLLEADEMCIDDIIKEELHLYFQF
jgi:hypothetical protein